MAATWESATVGDVKAGDRVRLESGKELQVTEVQDSFFGRPEMVAFIEETATSWYKQPARKEAAIEIWREG